MQVTTIGLDIAKNVFQVHGVDAKEKVVVRKQLRRSQVIAFFSALPPMTNREAARSLRRYARSLAASLPPSYTTTRDLTLCHDGASQHSMAATKVAHS